MRATTHPSRLNTVVTHLLDYMGIQDRPSEETYAGKGQPQAKRTRPERRDFTFYTKLVDHDTQELAGHLADVSSGGFKLDCPKQIPLNMDFRFSMNLSSEVADKPVMTFVARSKWCKVDPLDPYVYNAGFQLIHISPTDLVIFNRMVEKYGRVHETRNMDLRRSNKW